MTATSIEEQFTASVAATIAPEDDEPEASEEVPESDEPDEGIDFALLRASAEAECASTEAALAAAAAEDAKAEEARSSAEREHAKRVERAAELKRKYEEQVPLDRSESEDEKLEAKMKSAARRVQPAAEDLAEKTAVAKVAKEAHDAAKAAHAEALQARDEIPALETQLAVDKRVSELDAERIALERERPALHFDLPVRYGQRPPPPPPEPIERPPQPTLREREANRMHAVSFGGQVGVASWDWLSNPLGKPTGAPRPDDVYRPKPVSRAEWNASDGPALLADFLAKGFTSGHLVGTMGIHGHEFEPPQMRELRALCGTPPRADDEVGTPTFVENDARKLGILLYCLKPGGPTNNRMGMAGKALSVDSGKAAIQKANWFKYAPDDAREPSTSLSAFQPPLTSEVALQRARALEPQIVALRALGKDTEADRAEAEMMSLRAQAAKK